MLGVTAPLLAMLIVCNVCNWEGAHLLMIYDIVGKQSLLRHFCNSSYRRSKEWSQILPWEIISSCAEVVALWTNKRSLSAVNWQVGFQLRRFVKWVAAMVVIVIFLCFKGDMVDFGQDFWSLYSAYVLKASVNLYNWKNKVIWPEPFKEKWRDWKAILITLDFNVSRHLLHPSGKREVQLVSQGQGKYLKPYFVLRDYKGVFNKSYHTENLTSALFWKGPDVHHTRSFSAAVQGVA